MPANKYMTSNRNTDNIVSTYKYKPDLIKLKKLIPPDSSDKLSIESIIDCLPDVLNNQTALSKHSIISQPAQTLLKQIDKLYDLLTDHRSQISMFTRIIDRYCRDDALLANRLYEFIRYTVGPIIKLFAVEQDTRIGLAIEFPTQQTKQIFLRQMCIKDMQSELMQYDVGMEALFEESNKIVCLPAIKTAAQQLAIMIPSIKLQNRFLHLLNLGNTDLFNTDLINTDEDRSQLIINDRRILDTASKFHFSVVCPYFLEYCQIQCLAYTIAQGRRDHLSFFSREKLPKEMAITITLAAASANVIDISEQIDIAKSVIT